MDYPHIIIVIISNIWNDFIIITFSNDILNIHVILLSIMDVAMKKWRHPPITMSSSISQMHHYLYDYNFFPHRIWNNILWL